MSRDVALFITCLTDQFYPNVGIAVTKVLEHFGCTVRFPEGQTCCGQPFYNNGYHGEAASLARKFVDDFEPYGTIVTPSGSCCAMVREHFPHLLGHDAGYGQRMGKVVSRTFEFVEFLDKELKVDFSAFKLPKRESLTYHYTCHLRGIGIKDEGVRMLKEIGNVDFRPLEKTDQCCGFGGTFAVKYPAISGAMVDDKTRCIKATEAGTTVVNDAGCAMNIAGMCNRAGVGTRVRHMAELLCEALGMEADRW